MNNGPCSQPSGDGSLQTGSLADGVSKNDSDLKVPVSLRKSRPLSMDARIQVDEEKPITDRAENPGPAASKPQKANQSRPNSSALETLGGETLANGGLELPSSSTPGHSKRASDCSNLSTSESMDYGTSLSADLSLNKETGSLSLKVMSPVTLGARGGTLASVPCSGSILKSRQKLFTLHLICVFVRGAGGDPRSWCMLSNTHAHVHACTHAHTASYFKWFVSLSL